MNIKLTQLIYLLAFLFFSIGGTLISPSKSSAQYSQYQRDLQIQGLMFQAIQYCGYFERRAKSNSNDYEARNQLNNCLLMIYKKGNCERQKILESAGSLQPANFTECYLELARYAQYIGGRNR